MLIHSGEFYEIRRSKTAFMDRLVTVFSKYFHIPIF